MYQRELEGIIQEWLISRDVIIIYGARQVGKTTLVKKILETLPNSLTINCEQINVVSVLESMDISSIKALFGPNKVIALDEAQTVKNIGKVLKLIYDELPQYKIIATGSSSFELSNLISEPLTGRNIKFRLYPLSINEITNKNQWLWVLNNLNDMLVYGTYPGVVDLDEWNKQQKVINLASDYLFKDILAFDTVRNSSTLRKLIKALAFQIGNQVSVNELSGMLGITRPTVEKYIDLLEKCFIIFKLESFSSNLRNEIKKSSKYYFFDNGLLNAIIGNFISPLNRTDAGSLWENFVISEMIKSFNNKGESANFYFWRTYDGAEIDLVIENRGALKAYECKWSQKRMVKIPESFSQKYGVSELITLTPKNLHQLVSL